MSDYGAPTGAPGSVDRVYQYLIGQPTVAVPIVTLGATKLLYSGPCLLVGWSLIEPSGAVSVWDVFDGDDATGQLVGAIGLASGAASVVAPGLNGPYCKIGLTLVRVSGALRGGIWLKL